MERFELDFVWRGFELHPGIPPGGLDIARMFPPAQVDAMHARLVDVARGLGVPFTPQPHAPSTKPALAISELARRKGVLDAWRALAMDAHWQQGRDLEDEATLRELATAAGLDPDEALAFARGPEAGPVLVAQREEAARWGVTGIPTWFMLPAGWSPGDPRPEPGQPVPVRVVGCQPLEVVERAARMAGATPRG